MGFKKTFKKLFSLVLRVSKVFSTEGIRNFRGLLWILFQADEKERKQIKNDRKGRENTIPKETNRSKKKTLGDENHMTEQDEEKENMTEIVMDKKHMIEYDNNKKHTYGDEDSNREIALPEDNSCSTKESDNISSSKFGTKSKS